MPINLPSGVRKKDPSVVSITVTLAEKVEKIVENVEITYRNLGGWKATISEEETSTTNVKIIGTKEMVEDFDTKGIEVYIDFSELPDDANGLVELPLHVEGSNNLFAYESAKPTIQISVSK